MVPGAAGPGAETVALLRLPVVSSALAYHALLIHLDDKGSDYGTTCDRCAGVEDAERGLFKWNFTTTRSMTLSDSAI